MKLKQTAVIITAAFVLAACGQEGGSSGASAGSDSSSHAGLLEKITRAFSHHEEKTLTATYTTSAAPWIIEQITIDMANKASIGSLWDRGFAVFGHDVFSSEESPEKLEAYKKGYEFMVEDINKRLNSLLQQDPKNPLLVKRIQDNAAYDSWLAAMHQDHARMYIVKSVSPCLGWPVEPESKNGREYIATVSKIVIFANDLMLYLSAPLKDKVFANEEQAKITVLNRYLSIDPEKMRASFKDKYSQLDSGSAQVDMASGHGLTWSNNLGTFKCDESGMTVVKNGAPYYGAGYIGGKKVELQLAVKSVDAKDKSVSIEEQFGSDNSSGGAAKTTIGK